MKKLILLLMILFLLPICNALDYRNHCDNSSYLRKTMEFTSCEGNNCTDYNFTQLIQCEFGCDNSSTHQCNPSPYSWSLNSLFISGGAIFILVFALFLIKKKR